MAGAAAEAVITDEEFLADERFVVEGFRDADINGWRTRIFDQGEGEAIFFVPILRGLEAVYAKQLQSFAATNRVLIYERSESRDHPVGAEERAEEIRRILDYLGIERAHIVGLGDAGVPALNFGRMYPDRCLSITSMSLAARYRVPPYWLNEGVINPVFQHLPIERVLPHSVMRSMVIRATYGNGPLPKHLIGHMVDRSPDQARVFKYSVMPVTHHHDMRDWAGDLRVPILLITRDDDPLAPVEEMEELAAMLPDCWALEVVHDGGRFITYTRASQINPLLGEFFQAVATGQREGRFAGPPTTKRSRGNEGMAQKTRPRATEGRLISDEEWRADQEYVRDHLHHARIADWETELFDEGSGDPILYVPIVGYVEVVYAKQLRDFSRDYRAITYRRPDQVTKPVMIERRVVEIREVLDHLNIQRAHIVGRGEAGVAASNFAYTYPDRTRSLVLVSSGMRRDIPPVWLTRIVNRVVLHLPVEGWLVTPDRVRNQVVTYLSGSEQRLTYDQLMSVYRQIPNFHSVYKYAVTPLEIYHNLEGKAQKITAPTLLVTSDEDQRATEADLQELAAALPNCRGVHVIHQGGHFANYIQGDEFNHLVRAFYDQIAAETATGTGVSPEGGTA